LDAVINEFLSVLAEVSWDYVNEVLEILGPIKCVGCVVYVRIFLKMTLIPCS